VAGRTAARDEERARLWRRREVIVDQRADAERVEQLLDK